MSIKKIGNGASVTTSLYVTKGPDGEEVIFTPTDLVSGKGYLKSKGGKKFKPSKMRKGYSMANIVSKEGFGKVKK